MHSSTVLIICLNIYKRNGVKSVIYHGVKAEIGGAESEYPEKLLQPAMKLQIKVLKCELWC